MTDIATLPTDILSHIASFIPTTSDLHNVRDTCKPLYHAAIPRLYRRMVLHETLDSDKLAGLLSPDNVGLQHIRHLEIVSACGDHHNKKERIDSMLTLLACMLPRNVLMTFTLVRQHTFAFAEGNPNGAADWTAQPPSVPKRSRHYMQDRLLCVHSESMAAGVCLLISPQLRKTSPTLHASTLKHTAQLL